MAQATSLESPHGCAQLQVVVSPDHTTPLAIIDSSTSRPVPWFLPYKMGTCA